jgi:hypothetical protein
MPRVGFESASPVFERVKIFHALHRAATWSIHWLWKCTQTRLCTFIESRPSYLHRGRPVLSMDSNCQTRTHYLVMSHRWGSTPRQTDWPTVSRNVTSNLTLYIHSRLGTWVQNCSEFNIIACQILQVAKQICISGPHGECANPKFILQFYSKFRFWFRFTHIYSLQVDFPGSYTTSHVWSRHSSGG